MLQVAAVMPGYVFGSIGLQPFRPASASSHSLIAAMPGSSSALRPVNNVVGEIIFEIVAKGPHQPPLRQISGNERRSAERHAISRDGGLDHCGRVVDLQAAFAFNVRKAGVLQP